MAETFMGGNSESPKGIRQQSPGLRGTSYPGKRKCPSDQPRKGCGRCPSIGPQPLRGCLATEMGTQGSSFLATLGWRTQSLRDCGRVGNAEPFRMVRGDQTSSEFPGDSFSLCGRLLN